MNLDAKSFLDPLLGRTATFIVDGRSANLALAGALMSASAQSGVKPRVLDLNAFYSSNAEVVFRHVPPDVRGSILLDLPNPGSAIGPNISGLFDLQRGMVVIDSLNTLHHLLSRSGRGLSFITSALSVFCRANGSMVLMTMYKREGPPGTERRGSLSELSDLELHARVEGDNLVMRCTRGKAWPGNALVVGTT